MCFIGLKGILFSKGTVGFIGTDNKITHKKNTEDNGR